MGLRSGLFTFANCPVYFQFGYVYLCTCPVLIFYRHLWSSFGMFTSVPCPVITCLPMVFIHFWHVYWCPTYNSGSGALKMFSLALYHVVHNTNLHPRGFLFCWGSTYRCACGRTCWGNTFVPGSNTRQRRNWAAAYPLLILTELCLKSWPPLPFLLQGRCQSSCTPALLPQDTGRHEGHGSVV